MLLEGIIRNLPREHFHVLLCPIDAAGKQLSPRLALAADEVVRLGGKMLAARGLLGTLRWGPVVSRQTDTRSERSLRHTYFVLRIM